MPNGEAVSLSPHQSIYTPKAKILGEGCQDWGEGGENQWSVVSSQWAVGGGKCRFLIASCFSAEIGCGSVRWLRLILRRCSA